MTIEQNLEKHKAEILEFLRGEKPLPPLTDQQQRLLEASNRMETLAAISRLEKKLA